MRPRPAISQVEATGCRKPLLAYEGSPGADRALDFAIELASTSHGRLTILTATAHIPLRSRPVWTTDLVAFLLGAGMFSSFIVLPQFVETSTGMGFGFGASVTGAGLFMVPSTIAMLVIGPLAGPLQGRFGSRLPLIVGCGFAAAAFALLAVAHSRPLEVYVAAALLGIGIGLAFAAMANLIVEAVPPDQTGVATGVNTIARSVGGAFGGQIVATIIAGGGSPTEASFVPAFAVIAASLVLSIVAALAIPRPGTEASPQGRLRHQIAATSGRAT